jgi:hypothetical protein
MKKSALLLIAILFLGNHHASCSCNETDPLLPWYIGQQRGTTFVFDNGTEVTFGTMFVAYATKEVDAKKDRTSFGEAPNCISFGSGKYSFKQHSTGYIDLLLINSGRSFMGFAPKADGVIDSSLKLDAFRQELEKLGVIAKVVTDNARLDKKYPGAFDQLYGFLRQNYDEKGTRRKVGPTRLGYSVQDTDLLPGTHWSPVTWHENDPLEVQQKLATGGQLEILKPRW